MSSIFQLPVPPPLLRPRVAARLASALRSPRASSRIVACPISAAPKQAAPLDGGVRVERDHSVLSRRLRALVSNISKARHRASPPALSVRETISRGMSESMRDQRMTPGLAPVAFVDLTVPRATEAGKSPSKARPRRTRARARWRRGRTLTVKEGAVVGARAGERERVGMS